MTGRSSGATVPAVSEKVAVGEFVARVVAIGSVVLTVASLTLAVIFAHRETRIRVGFDVTRAVAGVGVATIVVAIALPSAAIIAGSVSVASTQVIRLTDEEICALTPSTGYASSPGIPDGTFYSASRASVEPAIAGCASLGYFDYTGLDVEFAVYLCPSDEAALAQWQTEITLTNDWYAE